MVDLFHQEEILVNTEKLWELNLFLIKFELCLNVVFQVSICVIFRHDHCLNIMLLHGRFCKEYKGVRTKMEAVCTTEGHFFSGNQKLTRNVWKLFQITCWTLRIHISIYVPNYNFSIFLETTEFSSEKIFNSIVYYTVSIWRWIVAVIS